VERAVILSPGDFIIPESLPAQLRGGGRQVIVDDLGNLTLDQAIDQAERRILLETLESLNWNRQVTARSLGISRTTLFNKMRRFDLVDPRRSSREVEPDPMRRGAGAISSRGMPR
jgi:transcriptional regulator of acetoin/glycerol metabolism